MIKAMSIMDIIMTVLNMLGEKQSSLFLPSENLLQCQHFKLLFIHLTFQLSKLERFLNLFLFVPSSAFWHLLIYMIALFILISMIETPLEDSV